VTTHLPAIFAMFDNPAARRSRLVTLSGSGVTSGSWPRSAPTSCRRSPAELGAARIEQPVEALLHHILQPVSQPCRGNYYQAIFAQEGGLVLAAGLRVETGVVGQCLDATVHEDGNRPPVGAVVGGSGVAGRGVLPHEPHGVAGRAVVRISKSAVGRVMDHLGPLLVLAPVTKPQRSGHG
jgi:hypothetical protein